MAQSAAGSSASTGVHHAPFKYWTVADLPEPWRGELTLEELRPMAAQLEVPIEKVVQYVVVEVPEGPLTVPWMAFQREAADHVRALPVAVRSALDYDPTFIFRVTQEIRFRGRPELRLMRMFGARQ